MFKQIVTAAVLSIGLAGCASQNWETNYAQLSPEQTAGWRLADVTVSVPNTLTTSEENTYTPNYDIVWHGEPYGDRRAQVGKILDDAITQGARSVLKGSKPVRIAVTVTQFHALSPITRATDFGNAGVHDIRYTAQVFDAKSGAPLTEPQAIKADLPGLTGQKALAAEAKGFTQRDEIVTHVIKVTENWLGYGQDVRTNFARMGR